MSLYGQILTSEDVRLALVTHLETWTPAYIDEVARQRSTTLPRFRGYATTADDTFPVCLTACAGTAGDIDLHGDGTITAAFAVGAAAVVAAATREEATAQAAWYGAAIRAAVLQHPDLSGFGAGMEWTGESLEEVAWDTTKAIMACVQRFTIWVNSVIDIGGGPATPPVDPTAVPGDFPAALTVDGTVTRTPTTDTTP